MVEVEYSLPDFAAPLNEDNMEGVVPFYSGIENKIYFIYSSIDGIHQMASCYLSDPYECTVEPLSEFDLDFFLVSRRIRSLMHEFTMSFT